MLQTFEDILRKRELRAVKIALGVRFAVLLLFLAMNPFIPQEQETISIVLTVIAIGLAVTSYALWQLIRKKETSMNLNAMLLIFFDSLTILALPYIWYIGLGGWGNVDPTFLLKTDIPLVMGLFIVLNAFYLRPIYPLLMTISCTMVQIFYFVWAYEYVNWGQTFVEVHLSDKVIWQNYLSSTITILCTGMLITRIVHSSRNTVIEMAKLERSQSYLGRYFSPKILEKISTSLPELTKQGADYKNIAVLFCDIRNYTSLCEDNSPAEIIELLSSYHKRIVHCVFEHGGHIDKFMGDGILATFGTLEESPNDCINAVQTAAMVLQQINQLNRERESAGKFKIQIGIGVHYGQALVGNIGTEERLEFTVIGDTVNTASRIEGRCKDLGMKLLFSDAVCQQVKESFSSQKVGEITLRGKKNSLALYTLRNE